MTRKEKAKVYLKARYTYLCGKYPTLAEKINESLYIRRNLPHVLEYDSWEDKIKISYGRISVYLDT